jgi:UDP-GlcNAc:undecaprenyl-phosphate/decaprenyl-phosphate GlcNAc-1-phosphate transferase
MPSVTVYCVNAFLLSLVFTLAMEKVAVRIGLVDIPTARKMHQGQIPLVGVAVFLAFGIASIMLHRQPAGFVGFLMGLALIVLLGVIDDMVDLRARIKLVAQCISVALMILPNDLVIRNAGLLLGDKPLLLSHLAIPATIFAVVGMINAVNMIDGLDGLAGGVTLTSLTWFAVAAAFLGLSDELLLILVLACSVLGFLVFNVRHPWRARALVFLGDAGSMMLGLSLAFVAISLSQRSGAALSPVAALWICALPVIDTLSLIVRRLAAGASILGSDHRHLHYLLLQAGLTVNQTVLVLVATSATLGGVGIAGWSLGVSDQAMLLGLTVPVFLHTWLSCHGWKHLRPVKGEVVANAGAIAQLEPWAK